jgi:hypothetical protein
MNKLFVTLVVVSLSMIAPAYATTCSTVQSITTEIRYGDTIRADVVGCSTLPNTPGPKHFDFWPRLEPYSFGTVDNSDLALGCPAGAWPGTTKTITWTTYNTAHPVIDIQWYYGTTQF